MEIPETCDSCDERPPAYQCARCRVWMCGDDDCPCLCVDAGGDDDDDDDDDDDNGDDEP